jgi:hypothetical protein
MAMRKTPFARMEKAPKKTSQGGNHTRISFHSMNKNKRVSYKRYRGQGR